MSCNEQTGAETFTSYLDLGPELDLIQFEEEENDALYPDMPSQLLSVPAKENMNQQTSDSSKKSEKLCGYLNKYKIGARGRIFKKRWFVFSDSTCKLLYYRTPQDVVPLGDMDISAATFSFHVGNTAGRQNVFEISCHGKVLQLEATDRKTMMYWLQELQEKRRTYSAKRTENARMQATEAYNRVVKDLGQDVMVQEPSSPPPLLDMVDIPCTVGEETASFNSSNMSDISFTNWRTELRNLLAGMRASSRHNSDCDSMRAVKQHRQEPSVGQLVECEEPAYEIPSLQSLHEQKQKDNAWNSLRRRLKVRSAGSAVDISHPLPGSGSTSCVKCKELESYISSLKNDSHALEEELIVHQELIKQIQKQYDIIKKEKETAKEMSLCFTDHDQMEVLMERDRKIVELEHLLATTQEEKEMCKLQMKDLEHQVAGLQDQILQYHRSIQQKDEQIMRCAEQITELEGGSMPSQRRATSTLIDTQELTRLQNAVEGYENQNKFLNQEILELNRLRRDDEAREQQLVLHCKEWEAKFYQIESKYLLCLDQLRMPVRGNESDATEEIVSQLLEDAMEGDAMPSDLCTKPSIRERYDEYGFTVSVDEGPNKLLARANSSKRRSEALKHWDADKEISQVVKWENFLLGLDKRPLQRSTELKHLTRSGIPSKYRKRVWKMFTDMRVGKEREKRGDRYYHDLLAKFKSSNPGHNPAVKQIELDLLRTLPHNRHYENFTSENVPKLRRVLLAYTQHNPTIGYCQGLNRLAAIALLLLDEEDAFWCMVAIIDYIMPPEYYSVTLLAAQSDQRVLKDFVQEKCPRLAAHLEKNDVDISLFTFNWFLTIFVDNIPVQTYLRIWDCFLYEGSKVLFRYAIAILKYREEKILAQTNNMELHHYLRTIGCDITDIDRVTQIAFTEINPFSMKNVGAKRHTHSEKVKMELAELDKLRENFRQNASTHEHPDILMSDED